MTTTPVETEPRIGEQLAGYSIAHLEAICAKATPGPWQARFFHRVIRQARISPGDLFFASNGDDDWPDSEFIAASRTALPAALQRIRELEEASADTVRIAEQAVWVAEVVRDATKNALVIETARASKAEEALKRLREAAEPFRRAISAYGNQPSDDTRLSNNAGEAWLEGALITFGDLRALASALTETETKEPANGR